MEMIPSSPLVQAGYYLALPVGWLQTVIDSWADAVSVLLEAPPAPQAARPKVKRLHNTTLRICEAAKVDCVI